MSNITATFQAAANSFSAYEQALEVVSNNTTNASTADYATQQVDFQAQPFSLGTGEAGGVTLSPDISSRDPYAEYNVQSAQSAVNYSTTLANDLESIEPLFSLNTSSATDSSIGGTMNQLFSSFSQLTTNPNDTSYRQAVITAAGNLADSFNDTANSLNQTAQNVLSQAQSTVQSINTILTQIQQINQQKAENDSANSDAGIDAQLYSNLENLSQLVNFTTTTAADGETSIYLGGQQPLLIGTHQYSLSTTSTSGTLQVIDSASGSDISSFATGGQLGALVQLNHVMIPGYQSQLNQLAQTLADTVNTQLESGTYQDASNTTQPGVALFSYNSTAPAKTLAVTSITATQIAAASSANPSGSDNATTIAGLQTAVVPALSASFADFYGNLASKVGSDSGDAQNNQTTQQQLLSQAQTLRSNMSGVSLDDQATLMTEYEQSYDAISKLITVLSQISQNAIDLIALPGTPY